MSLSCLPKGSKIWHNEPKTPPPDARSHNKIADFQIDDVAAQEKHEERDEEPAILRLVDLMDKEGLVYDKSRAYRDAAECALKQGLREEALEYAGKELDVESCCVGRDAPSYLEAISFFLKIYFGPEEIVD